MRELNIANIPPAGDERPMRSVVQRVDRASVSVGECTISRIENGLLVFLGVEGGDTEVDAD
ncbi:MAG TPA: D-aminoacyl-tRNA deacylase, partial [Syntrophales bacterium]|nr:D-aminoacyl-tRNA deacylase [Syntrophales bacterium]